MNLYKKIIYILMPLKFRLKLSHRFRKTFDCLSDPAMLIEYRDGEFYCAEFNFAMYAITETKIYEYYGKPVTQIFSHEPRIIKGIFECYFKKTVVREVSKYYFRTIQKEKLIEANCTYIDSQLMLIVIRDVSQILELQKRIARMIFNYLTRAERDVVFYIAHGISRAEIAAIMSTTRGVIDVWISRLKNKLGEDFEFLIYMERENQDIMS